MLRLYFNQELVLLKPNHLAIINPYQAFATETFSMLVTRYSFHHFLEPKAVLNEMYRVCKPGGVILIADVALAEDKIEAYNQMEKLRDPSHTRALSHNEFEQLMTDSGLKNLQQGSYSVEMELEKQLQASFPNPGDEQKIRAIFQDDLKHNRLGVGAKKIADKIHFSYPISVYMGIK